MSLNNPPSAGAAPSLNGSNGAGNAGTITLLYGPDVCAAKGNGQRKLGFTLFHSSVAVESLSDLVGLLESLKSQPGVYVVRGDVADGAPPRIRRRSRHAPYHLVDTPRQWICVDIDGRPSVIDCHASPMAAVVRAREALPGGLSTAACYYALTASCEPHVLHAHLWFYLDRPYSNSELRRNLAGYCDTSLFKPTQPHFTAAPLIPGDTIDRRGLLDGEPMGWLGSAPLVADPAAAETQLQSAMAEVAAQTKGNRHYAVNRRAYFMGRHVCTGAIERARVIECLVSAATLAGLTDDRARDEVQRGLADGIAHAPMAEQWRERLERGKEGAQRSSYLNSIIALSESTDWAGALGWNERHHRVEWIAEPPLTAGLATAVAGAPFRDEHAMIAAEWFARNGFSYTRANIIDAALDVAHKQPFDPVRERLEEFDWDGKERLSEMFLAYFGCDPSKAEWLRAIARRWMVSAVARVYRPGCKADNLLVLEGPQGRYKSTALEVLGMGYMREIRVALDDKDAADALHSGVWIAVLTELDSFKATHRAEAIKAFLSMADDYFRRSYARTTQAYSRSTVFAATTNEETYLIDPTGNRRFWPVACGLIDIDALRRDVEQLWAEARQAYLNGEPWWLDSDDLVTVGAVEQAARLIPDTWEDTVADYLKDKDFTTLRQIFDHLMIELRDQSQPSTARVRRYLTQLGYHVQYKNGVKGYERK